MAELIIKTPGDLKKLEGWRIERVGIAQGGILVIRVSHPVASCHVEILVRPQVTMGLSGNIVMANPEMLVKSRDIMEEEK